MFQVGSWQFYTLTVSIVVILFVVCHYWDEYDKYKIKRSQRYGDSGTVTRNINEKNLS